MKCLSSLVFLFAATLFSTAQKEEDDNRFGGNRNKPERQEWLSDLVITRGAINTPEQTVHGTATDALWESCITMGIQWQYKPTNDDLKPGGRLIELLIETRAKGGNLLLNFRPHPDGYIPFEQETQLRKVAYGILSTMKRSTASGPGSSREKKISGLLNRKTERRSMVISNGLCRMNGTWQKYLNY